MKNNRTEPPNPEKKQRMIWIILLLLGAVYFVWIGPVFEQTQRTILDPDSIYHLNRVVDALDDFPSISSYDKKSHYPEGNWVHWPNTYTFFLACLCVAFKAQSVSEIIAILSWVPVTGGLIAFFSVFWILKRLKILSVYVIPMALFLICSYESNHIFLFGTIDHHWAMQIAFLWMVASLWTHSPTLSVIGCSVALLATPESLIFVSLFLILIALRDTTACKGKPISQTPQSSYWLYIAPGIIALAVFAFHSLLDDSQAPLLSMSVARQSLFQPTWFISLGISGAASVYWWKNKGTSRNSWFWLIVPIFALLGWFLFFSVGSDPTAFIQRIWAADRIFVGEEKSPFFVHTIWSLPFHYLLYGGLLGSCILFFFVDKAQRFIWITLIFLIILGIKEMRYLRVVAPIVYIGWIFVVDALQRIFTHRSFSKGTLNAVLLLISMLVAMASGQTLKRRFLSQNEQKSSQIIEEIKAWSDRKPTHFHQKSNGVFAPWSYGHQIQFFSNRGVTVDPFNFPSPISNTLRALHLEENPDALNQKLDHFDIGTLFLHKSGIDFLSVANSNIVNSAQFVHDGKQIHLLRDKMNQSYLIPNLELNFNIPNLLLGMRLVHASQELRSHPYTEFADGPIRTYPIPNTQVFDRGPKVTIRGKLPQDEATVVLVYDTAVGQVIRRQTYLPKVEDGLFCLEVANPAPSQIPNFSIDTPYILICGPHIATVPVTPEDLEEEQVFNIEWSIQDEKSHNDSPAE